jgi:hypothetical protein
MKSGRKMRMIPQHGDILGSDPKLQFNFFGLIVHDALHIPADGMVAALYPNGDLGTSVETSRSLPTGMRRKLQRMLWHGAASKF